MKKLLILLLSFSSLNIARAQQEDTTRMFEECRRELQNFYKFDQKRDTYVRDRWGLGNYLKEKSNIGNQENYKVSALKNLSSSFPKEIKSDESEAVFSKLCSILNTKVEAVEARDKGVSAVLAGRASALEEVARDSTMSSNSIFTGNNNCLQSIKGSGVDYQGLKDSCYSDEFLVAYLNNPLLFDVVSLVAFGQGVNESDFQGNGTKKYCDTCFDSRAKLLLGDKVNLDDYEKEVKEELFNKLSQKKIEKAFLDVSKQIELAIKEQNLYDLDRESDFFKKLSCESELQEVYKNCGNDIEKENLEDALRAIRLDCKGSSCASLSPSKLMSSFVKHVDTRGNDPRCYGIDKTQLVDLEVKVTEFNNIFTGLQSIFSKNPKLYDEMMNDLDKANDQRVTPMSAIINFIVNQAEKKDPIAEKIIKDLPLYEGVENLQEPKAKLFVSFYKIYDVFPEIGVVLNNKDFFKKEFRKEKATNKDFEFFKNLNHSLTKKKPVSEKILNQKLRLFGKKMEESCGKFKKDLEVGLCGKKKDNFLDHFNPHDISMFAEEIKNKDGVERQPEGKDFALAKFACQVRGEEPVDVVPNESTVYFNPFVIPKSDEGKKEQYRRSDFWNSITGDPDIFKYDQQTPYGLACVEGLEKGKEIPQRSEYFILEDYVANFTNKQNRRSSKQKEEANQKYSDLSDEVDKIVIKSSKDPNYLESYASGSSLASDDKYCFEDGCDNNYSQGEKVDLVSTGAQGDFADDTSSGNKENVTTSSDSDSYFVEDNNEESVVTPSFANTNNYTYPQISNFNPSFNNSFGGITNEPKKDEAIKELINEVNEIEPMTPENIEKLVGGASDLSSSELDEIKKSIEELKKELSKSKTTVQAEKDKSQKELDELNKKIKELEDSKEKLVEENKKALNQVAKMNQERKTLNTVSPVIGVSSSSLADSSSVKTYVKANESKASPTQNFQGGESFNLGANTSGAFRSTEAKAVLTAFRAADNNIQELVKNKSIQVVKREDGKVEVGVTSSQGNIIWAELSDLELSPKEKEELLSLTENLGPADLRNTTIGRSIASVSSYESELQKLEEKEEELKGSQRKTFYKNLILQFLNPKGEF